MKKARQIFELHRQTCDGGMCDCTGALCAIEAESAIRQAQREALKEAANLVVYGKDKGHTMAAVARNILALERRS